MPDVESNIKIKDLCKKLSHSNEKENAATNRYILYGFKRVKYKQSELKI